MAYIVSHRFRYLAILTLQEDVEDREVKQEEKKDAAQETDLEEREAEPDDDSANHETSKKEDDQSDVFVMQVRYSKNQYFVTMTVSASVTLKV